MKELCDFTMNFPKRPGIEFDRLKKLDFAQWYYNAKDTGLGSLKHLRDVGLCHYNPKHKSFEGLDLPDAIVDLGIVFANPKSLLGLPELPRLKKFQIARCRNLETIGELPRIAPNVEFIDIESCGRLSDAPSVFRQLPKLRHAFVDNEEIVCRPDKNSRLL